MTFLQPAVLIALPVAALPVVIHLVHLYRRRQIKWAAMIFLRAAQQMNKGLSRLRQILILALRVLAVAAIILVVGRPLAGGWLGLTGGAPDTVLILLDRSASMEQKDMATGVSKRVAGLRNLAKAINDTIGRRSHLVLIDSALGKSLRSNARTRCWTFRRLKPPTPPLIFPPSCRRRLITLQPIKPAAPTSGC